MVITIPFIVYILSLIQLLLILFGITQIPLKYSIIFSKLIYFLCIFSCILSWYFHYIFGIIFYLFCAHLYNLFFRKKNLCLFIIFVFHILWIGYVQIGANDFLLIYGMLIVMFSYLCLTHLTKIYEEKYSNEFGIHRKRFHSQQWIHIISVLFASNISNILVLCGIISLYLYLSDYKLFEFISKYYKEPYAVSIRILILCIFTIQYYFSNNSRSIVSIFLILPSNDHEFIQTEYETIYYNCETIDDEGEEMCLPMEIIIPILCTFIFTTFIGLSNRFLDEYFKNEHDHEFLPN